MQRWRLPLWNYVWLKSRVSLGCEVGYKWTSLDWFRATICSSEMEAGKRCKVDAWSEEAPLRMAVSDYSYSLIVGTNVRSSSPSLNEMLGSEAVDKWHLVQFACGSMMRFSLPSSNLNILHMITLKSSCYHFMNQYLNSLDCFLALL